VRGAKDFFFNRDLARVVSSPSASMKHEAVARKRPPHRIGKDRMSRRMRESSSFGMQENRARSGPPGALTDDDY